MNSSKQFLSVILSVCILGTASVVYGGLMANWNFDAGALTDNSGNGRTLLTDHGSAEYTANSSGKALNVSGDSFYYDFGDSAQLNNFTISLWTKTGTGSNAWKNYWALLSDIQQTGTANDYAGLRFQLRDAGSGKVSGYTIYNGGGSANYEKIPGLDSCNQTFDSAVTLPFSDYQHVVFTVNDGAAKLYIDGAVAWSGNWTSTRQIGLFSLAGCRKSTGRDINGQLDAVSVYNCGLSAEEVGLMYAAGSNTTTAFHTQYAQTLSGTAANWGDAAWTRTISTQTTAGTPNQPWTQESVATLTSDAAATININDDVKAVSITTNKDNAKIVTLNVADGKTVTVAKMIGAFTKAGDGTIVVTDKGDIGGNLKVKVTDGVLDLSSPNAQIFATTYRNGAANFTVSGDGVLKCNNFCAYNGSLGCLRSEAPARVLDGGTVQITSSSNTSGSNVFTVSANGGTLDLLNAGVTTTFNSFKYDGYTDANHTTKLSEYAECATILNGDLTISGAGNVVLNGRLTGTGDLISNTTGTVTLSNVLNDFTGDVLVNSGSFILTTTEALNGKLIAGNDSVQITVNELVAKADKTVDLADYEGFTVDNLTSETGSRMLLTVDENGNSNAL
nr:LamG domain-containing protein [Thermoguttaceae bacterium]